MVDGENQMINFSFTRKGNRDWNEDRVYSCDDFAFVLDGATCLTKDHFSSFGSDAEWYADWWCEYLKVQLKNIKKTIPDILKSGIKKVVQAYKKMSNNQIPEDFPSATFSVVRRVDGILEMYSLCDTSIIFLSKNGDSLFVQDSSNCVNDGFNVIRMREFSKRENISLVDARRKFAEIVMNGRKTKNQPGGYHVLSNSEDAIDYGFYNKIEENLISKVMIMSDGYSQVFDVVKFMTYDKLIKKVNTLADVEKIYNKLYKYQESDKGGDRYYRFKLRDDASVAFMKF